MAHPSKAELTYEPELTGLLIVDPYNDFLSEGGKLYELSRSTLEANNVVEHMRQVLAAARAAGVQVFIAPHHRWRESDPYSHWKTMPAELGYEVALVKDAIGSFGHAEMDASLQFNIPAYASAVVSTDEIVAKLSA